jgi:subtilisin family serine protease
VTKTARIAIVCLSLFLAVPLVTAQDRPTELYNGYEVVSREVIVKFRPATRETLARIQSDEDIVYSEGVGAAVLLRSGSRNVSTLVRNFSARPEVEYAEPNFVLRANILPNDPSFGSLWGLHNTGQSIQGTAGTPDADIDAPEAWDITKGSKAIVLASIDTGVDFAHPDLAANIWSAPTAFTVVVGGVAFNCPAGTHGFNAITNACGGADDNDHGTHTAGTMGAVGNNGVGVAGVNWNVSLIGCKFLSASGSGSTADAVQCLEWVRKTRDFFGGADGAADVLATNNSYGGGPSSATMLAEIQAQDASGILFVAAAGNESSNNDVVPAFPANYNVPNVISVGATHNKDRFANFSNYGLTTVHLAAPGQGIFSTTRNNGYQFFSGTSMASPHVAGALGLMKSACRTATHTSLKADLLASVDPAVLLTRPTITKGRLNVFKAIQACQ